MATRLLEVSKVEDIARICRLCGKNFAFTSGEQVFYLERGYRPPEFCPDCRDLRRSMRSEQELKSTYMNRPGFEAVCSVCGSPTTVPFRPDPDRPLYCASCYALRRKGSSGR